MTENLKISADENNEIDSPKWLCPWCVFGKEKQLAESYNIDRLNQCFEIIIKGITSYTTVSKQIIDLQTEFQNADYFVTFMML